MNGLILSAVAILIAVGACWSKQPQPQIGIAYEVNSTGDGAQVGNAEACNDGTGHCTLRAAIQVSNNHAGVDAITFAIPTSDPNYNGIRWIIPIATPLPDVSDGVNIIGPGADQLAIVRKSNRIPPPQLRILRITSTGTVSLSGLKLDDGSLPGSDLAGGAGINHAGSGTVNVSNCEISNCVAHQGGAISNSGGGQMAVTDCWLHDNAADELGTTSSVAGGAIYNPAGNVTITRSTLTHNRTIPGGNASGDGAGVYNNDRLTIVNSTIAYNSNSPRTGSAGGAGMGVFNGSGGSLIITNGTVASNTDSTSSPIGGGVFSNNPNAASAQIKSCLTAKNHGGDVSGVFTSLGFNLIGAADGSSGFTQPTDQKGTIMQPLDPKLDVVVRANGGVVPTFALLSASPAIDKGTSNGFGGLLATDQRGAGYERTADFSNVPNANGGDGTDIGAYEFWELRVTNTARPVDPHAQMAIDGVGFPNRSHTILISPDPSPASFTVFTTVTTTSTGAWQYVVTPPPNEPPPRTRFYRFRFP